MQVFSMTIFAQADGGGGGGIGGVIGGLLGLIIFVLVLVGWWKMFTKAAKPGWACIIPIYNAIVLCDIAGRPLWWALVISFVPCVNVVFWVILCMDIAKSYGKEGAYGIGLLLLPFIFFPLLGLGDAKYVGPAAAAGAGGAAA